MGNLAIIPARGGSKRIPRKNIKDFLGKPIIAYSIDAALQSGLFDEVMVSTDDNEIAEIAIEFGAKVPFFRSHKCSDDYATTLDVIKEVVFEYQVRFDRIFDYVCRIYPTAPLIQVPQLKRGYDLIRKGCHCSVFPVVEFSYPIWRGVEINDEGLIKLVWPEYENARSQDLKKVYHDAGQWYWMDMNSIRDSIFTNNSAIIVLNEEDVQDIDSLSDWKLSEMKYKINIIKQYDTI